jgi:hypothetical protein
VLRPMEPVEPRMEIRFIRNQSWLFVLGRRHFCCVIAQRRFSSTASSTA